MRRRVSTCAQFCRAGRARVRLCASVDIVLALRPRAKSAASARIVLAFSLSLSFNLPTGQLALTSRKGQLKRAHTQAHVFFLLFFQWLARETTLRRWPSATSRQEELRRV